MGISIGQNARDHCLGYKWNVLIDHWAYYQGPVVFGVKVVAIPTRLHDACFAVWLKPQLCLCCVAYDVVSLLNAYFTLDGNLLNSGQQRCWFSDSLSSQYTLLCINYEYILSSLLCQWMCYDLIISVFNETSFLNIHFLIHHFTVGAKLWSLCAPCQVPLNVCVFCFETFPPVPWYRLMNPNCNGQGHTAARRCLSYDTFTREDELAD